MNQQRLLLTTLLVGVLVGPSTSFGQVFSSFPDSKRSQMFELKFGSVTPDVDNEAGLNDKPYNTIFGDDGLFMMRIEYDYQIWQGFGSLAIGVELGYGSVSGSGLETGSDDSSTDSTEFNMIPMSLSVVYHFDVLAIKWNIPIVPFVKGGIDYNIWWINDGVGETATYETIDPDSLETSGFEGQGDTFGWHVAGGIKVLLDTFAPDMAQGFDRDMGVNNSYLFAELVYAVIDDFGSKKSFHLGGTSLLFGIAFEH
jgi:hypothetical protein